MSTDPGFYAGIPTIPQFQGQGQVDKRLVSTSEMQDKGGPNYRYGGLLTYEKPIVEWWPDIVVPAGTQTLLRSGVELPTNCVNVAGTPTVSINGFGARSLFNFDSYDNTEIQSIYLILGAGDSVTVQSAGTGD
jgi:hypothetical protein